MITACWAELLCTNIYGENVLTGTWQLTNPLPVLMLPDSTVAKVSDCLPTFMLFSSWSLLFTIHLIIFRRTKSKQR